MIEFLLGCFVGRFIRLDDTRDIINKWDAILNYSSYRNGEPMTLPVPIQDRQLVANLLEQAERYCIRHPEEDISALIPMIRKNYKNMSFDFS